MMLLFAVQPFVDKGAIALILDAILVRSDHAASLIHVYIAASRITVPNCRRGGPSSEQLTCYRHCSSSNSPWFSFPVYSMKDGLI